MNKVAVADWSKLADRVPAYALVANVDLVVVRYGDDVSVLYGRCLHRGALLSDGAVDGDNLICGLHNWDYRIQTGISEYNNHEVLRKFGTWIENGTLYVDEDEIAAWEKEHPQPYKRDEYQGLYADVHRDLVEPHVALIQKYATEGLSKTGHHGVVEAMGVPRQELPSWDDIQILVRPAHREGHRRRARGRLRLHHPRRPRRRDRRRAPHLPRQHLGADDPGAGAGAAAPRQE